MYTLYLGFEMKCNVCGSLLVSLYCRDGAGGKCWIKVKEKYCKTCKKVKGVWRK